MMSVTTLPPFAELARELPPSSPRAWRFAALRVASRAGAGLSEGLAIGYRDGFDSGAFMEHVYANRPVGRTALGRVLDRRLLARPTCQAFRDIRALAEVAVLEAIDATLDAGVAAPVVADVAAGPAPYLLEALRVRPTVHAVLRDLDPGAVRVAASHADRLGLGARVDCAVADAFDVAALAASRPRPDIVLELGFYGIYHDDARVAEHLRQLGELVCPSQIVCNVQSDNPEIEYIARVWRNRAGGPCVWRLRPASTILAWAAAAGYVPASITRDRHGIYRVMRMVRDQS
jgi:Putative methyltransferase